MTRRLLLAALAALLLSGCATSWGLRAGVVLPDGTEPYLELHFGGNEAAARREENRPAVERPANAVAD